MTDEEVTLMVTMHPSFAVRVCEYAEMARSGALFDGMDESLEDIEELRSQILSRWAESEEAV